MNHKGLNIRKMEEKDVLDVVQLEMNFFSQPWGQQSLQDTLTNPLASYWVAEYEGRIIGECGMWHCLDEGEITNFAVHLDYHNQGIGSHLMKKLLEHGNTIGIKQILLEVRKSNEQAIQFYKKFRFEIEGIRKNFYEKPLEDAIIMWKR